MPILPNKIRFIRADASEPPRTKGGARRTPEEREEPKTPADLLVTIDTLFQVVRRPDREQFSNEEAARACRDATGGTFSAPCLRPGSCVLVLASLPWRRLISVSAWMRTELGLWHHGVRIARAAS